MKYIFWCCCSAAMLFGCKTIDAPTRQVAQCYDTSTLTPEDNRLADSLLAVGLDNEALYTLFAPLKPISTIAQFSMTVPPSDSTGKRNVVSPDAPDLARVRQFQRIANALHSERVMLLLIPFRRVEKGKRFFQLVAVDKPLLAQYIARDQAFWGQWGFVSESNLATVLTVTEFEEKLERYRGYGYLFGYPEHAITFFVEAARSQDSTGVFVKRDFFQIPVYSGKEGHFVYAVPKGYTPTESDSVIYRTAVDALERYKRIRTKYLNADGRLRAIDLLRDACNR